MGGRATSKDPQTGKMHIIFGGLGLRQDSSSILLPSCPLHLRKRRFSNYPFALSLFRLLSPSLSLCFHRFHFHFIHTSLMMPTVSSHSLHFLCRWQKIDSTECNSSFWVQSLPKKGRFLLFLTPFYLQFVFRSLSTKTTFPPHFPYFFSRFPFSLQLPPPLAPNESLSFCFCSYFIFAA